MTTRGSAAPPDRTRAAQRVAPLTWAPTKKVASRSPNGSKSLWSCAGRVTLQNVSITGSGAYGLYVFQNGTVTASNVTYEGNALGNFGL